MGSVMMRFSRAETQALRSASFSGGEEVQRSEQKSRRVVFKRRKTVLVCDSACGT